MGWKAIKSKLNIKAGKEPWLMILGLGLVCLILAFPMGEGSQDEAATWSITGNGDGSSNVDSAAGQTGFWGAAAQSGRERAVTGQADQESAGTEGGMTVSASAKAALTYEQQLEERLEEILSHVEGVGTVEVMIVLKTSEEKVWRVDQDTSYSTTQETDQNGGSRKIENQDISQDTILTGQSGQEGPLLEKEIKPEIGGVVISAAGGGSPAVQAEISAAVEALFDVPSHKIKVLKRVEGM